MVDAVNIGGGGTVFAPVAQQSSRASASPVEQAAKTLGGGTATQAPTLTPLFYDDPLAGILVTEQLDTQGNIVSQNPSSSVLAYLHNGLTIDGYPKASVTA